MARGNSQTTIIAPSQSVRGMSQGQLGDEWWKTIYAIPAASHFGLFDDSTDRSGRRGSLEKVVSAPFDTSLLFLGGGFGEMRNNKGTDGVLKLERTIVLPQNGKGTVFLPLLNANFDNLVNDLNDPENITGNKSIDQLRSLLAGIMNPTSEGGDVSTLFASIDDTSLRNPTGYRQATPSDSSFDYTAPFPTADGLLGKIDYSDDTYLDNPNVDAIQLKQLAVDNSVTIGPSVADGYWLAAGISGGSHTLRFGGSFGPVDNPNFALDVTYNILNPIEGSGAKDLLTGSCNGDYLAGRGSNDRLLGNPGNDLLLGGKGADVIDGGRDRDELWGGPGMDTFIFKRNYGKDAIFDFKRGETVKTPGLKARHVNEIVLPSAINATQVDFGGGDVLTFVGVSSGSLVIQSGAIHFG